jgi:hypothetical protein
MERGAIKMTAESATMMRRDHRVASLRFAIRDPRSRTYAPCKVTSIMT